jgi:tetratricopeptide (TPR) repeat protein
MKMRLLARFIFIPIFLVGLAPVEADKPEWMLILEQAEVMLSNSRYEESCGLAHHSLRLAEQELDTDAIDLSRILYVIAECKKASGDYAQAENVLQRNIVINEKHFGAGSKEVIQARVSLAELYWDKGDAGKAEELLKQVLAMLQVELEGSDPLVGKAMEHLGRFYLDQQRPEEAQDLLIKSNEIARMHEKRNPDEYAASLNLLCSYFITLSKYPEALKACGACLDKDREIFGKDDPIVASDLRNIVLIYLGMGQLDLAKESQYEAIQILQNALGVDHPDAQEARRDYDLIVNQYQASKFPSVT